MICLCLYIGFAHEALAQAFVSLETLKASSHALHMPSHTFIRLGLWEDAVGKA